MNRVLINGNGTFNSVIEKIKFISVRFPEWIRKISISMVIDPQEDVDQYKALSNSLQQLGVESIRASIVDLSYEGKNVAFSDDYRTKSEYDLFLAFLCG